MIERNNRVFGLGLLCFVGQLLVAELLEYSFDEYPKLMLLGVNLWLFLLGCLVAATPAAHFYSAINIISIASIFVFYVKPMYILHQRTDSYPLVSYSSLLFLTAFNAVFYSTYTLRTRALLRRAQEERVHRRATPILVGVLWCSWALGVVAFARNILAEGGLSDALLTSTYVERTLANTEASFGEQLSDALGAACFLAPVVLFDCYRKMPRYRWLARVLLAMILASIPALLLLTGSRRVSLAIVFALGVILLRDPPRWARISALVAAFVSPFLLAYWTALRAFPLADIDLEVLIERRDHVMRILFETPELSMFDEYLKVFADFGGKLTVRWGVDYYKIFLVPVPRTVLPDKPLASGTQFLDHYYPDWYDSIGGAVTISTPGELLWNLSYLGILGAIVYAMFFAYVDQRWLRANDPIKRSLYLLGGFALAFGFVRGGHHLVLLEFLKLAWPALIALVLTRYFGSHTPR